MQTVNSENEIIHVTTGSITLCIRDYRSVGKASTQTQTDIEPNTNISMSEEWKELGSEYPGYTVSSWGRVKGRKGRIFNRKPNERGYVRCEIINYNNQSVVRYAHTLIATAFIPNPTNKPLVNHINGKRDDNRVSNLEWATHSENSGPMKLNQVRGNCRRRVIQYSIEGNPVDIWDSVADAAYTVHGHASHVSRACCGILSTYCGYKWRYYDEMVNPENEQWKCLEYKGTKIEVSNLGRIRNTVGRIVGYDTNAGYEAVCINVDTIPVHRIVCMAWKPIEHPEMFVVNHIDNNGKNNRIENLEWVTQGDNVRHYRANFYIRHNYGRPVKQLSKDGMSLIATFGSATEASEKTGINQSNITGVCRNRYKSAGGFIWQYS